MAKILVLEDEEDIRAFVVINLKRAGYEILQAGTGEEALEIFRNNDDIDIAVLDVMLPGIDGMEVCKIMREEDKRIGILMLTAKSQELDRISGLSIGADDYMSKPFSPAELVARVDAISRRVDMLKGDTKSNKFESGPFKLDCEGRTLYKNGDEIELTQIEYSMMKFFIENRNQSLSREDILNNVWGESYFGDPKIVDVNIRRLRRKIEDDSSNPQYIRTVWGYGYKWKQENDKEI
ncbi:MAG: response regulator transcription factor [Andreesenia angusta]|nr:response regulator transcription factor [Andreesenia angusta]